MKFFKTCALLLALTPPVASFVEDFDSFSVGEVVDKIEPGNGFTIKVVAKGCTEEAMIFDSASPTGGADLRGVVLNDIKAEVSNFSPAEYYYQYYSRDTDDKDAAPKGPLRNAVHNVRHRLGNRRARHGQSTSDAEHSWNTGDGSSEYEDVLKVTDDPDRT